MNSIPSRKSNSSETESYSYVIEEYQNSFQNLSEYWQAFINYLVDKIETENHKWIYDIEQIIQACLRIEKSHAPTERYTWWNYTEHLYEVTRNYLDLWDKISQKRILACLHHDDIEDIKGETFKSFRRLYDTEVAFVIHMLSKKVDSDGKKMENADQEFFDRFKDIYSLEKIVIDEARSLWIPIQDYKWYIVWNISDNLDTCDLIITKAKAKKIAYQIATIKICDRINNLSTEHEIWKTDEKKLERAIRKLQQTEDIFIPLAQSMRNYDLFDRLRKEVIFLTRRINVLKSRIALTTES